MQNEQLREDISNASYYNKAISLKCIVSGKSLSPYCIPKKIKVSCIVNNSEKCDKCSNKIKYVLDIKPIDEKVLLFIDVHSTRVYSIIKLILKTSCDIEYEFIEMQNVERIYIMPTVGKDRHKTKMAPVSYYIGNGLDVNVVYNMKGYTTVDPFNQTVTHVFTSAIRDKSDIECFSLTKKMYDKLSMFCVKDPDVEKIYEHLDKVYTSYSRNITKIYDRFDLHLAVDLVFKSVLSFNFDNEYVHKGWMDAIVVGDTRCGKGYVAERLSTYFGLGEVVSAENCSFAGLVAGLQQFNKHWVVSWGKVPLNDGGLVILDEASELDSKDWTKLSRIRSEGVAEITKINTQITAARTRLLFLTNPILKTISNYSYGVQSLNDIVKAPEDIARFDYALVVAHNEVEVHNINKHRDTVPQMYSEELERQLVLWIWSRKLDDIVFSKDAVDAAYSFAILLAKAYSFSIPLIQGENIRIKLAKIAAAFAGRVFSNKEDGKVLYVDKVHIECAYYFINMLYKKQSCGYYALSQLNKMSDLESIDRDFSMVDKYLNAFVKSKDEICKCLLSNNNIQVNDISEHVNLEKEVARQVVSTLLKYNCLIKKHTYYVKTPAFTGWLKSKVLSKIIY